MAGWGSLKMHPWPEPIVMQELPEYMIPSYLIPVDHMPITANGKLDRKALFSLIKHGNDEEANLSKSIDEEKLATIWADVLQLPEKQISVTSDFFDIGGHSLNATILQAKVEKQLGSVISLRQIFSTSSLRDMAALLTTDQKEQVLIPRVKPAAHYPATSGQRRLYALQKLDENSVSYNISGCVQVYGTIEHAKVTSAIEAIALIQDAFRTTFDTIDHQLVQQIADQIDISVETIESDHENINFHDYVRPFDLQNGPLFRVSIIRTPTDSLNYLLFDIHHIIADGLSMKRIIEDFKLAYEGQNLIAPPLQYQDYSAWLQSADYSKLLKPQIDYWHKEFANGFTRLALPLDFNRPELIMDDGGDITHVLNSQRAESLKKLIKGANVTAFSMFTTLLSTLLSRICQSQEVIIGTPVVNRPHDDLMKVVGFFTNMLPIVNQVHTDEQFDAYLKQVHQKVLEVLENQQYLFEDLAKTVDPHRKPGHNPIFDVVLEFDNLDLPGLTIDDAKVSFVNQHSQKSKFDLLIQIAPTGDLFRFRFQYRKSLFEESTIQWMMDSFISLIDDVVANPAIKIGALNSHERQSTSEEIEFEF
ncbi:MAG: condensation domain-containing protein [Bacteroidota bacterium]